MQALRLLAERGRPLTVLCLGAHCDDIEIGCGGTLLRLLGEAAEVRVHWVVWSHSGNEARRSEALASAEALLGASAAQVEVKDFRDGYLPFVGERVKDEFEAMKGQVQPDVIFTHSRGDLHQDHRLIEQLTWNTWRDHLILEYETPKYDGDMGRPNVFVPLSEDVCGRKVELLEEHFATQRGRRWFDRETFLGLLRLRGMECNSASGYAEGFFGHKVVI